MKPATLADAIPLRDQDVARLLALSPRLPTADLMAADEADLARYLVSTAVADPSYWPSTSVRQLIRSLNAKLALTQ